jgi:GTP-binding protein
MGDHAPRRRALSAAPALFPAEPAPDAAAIEAGRYLFAQDCHFTTAAGDPGSLPPDLLPEIAFVGRSNVGKSSLVNALTGRTTLARVSHTPGRTRDLIFFELGRRLMLVDLPGYGFAAAPKTEIARWGRLIPLYLKGRAGLKRTLLLIDGRHGIKPADQPLMKLLDETAVSYQVVLTKADKVGPAELAGRLDATAAELARHGAAHPQIHLTSAHDGFGIAELRAAVAALAAPAPAG